MAKGRTCLITAIILIAVFFGMMALGGVILMAFFQGGSPSIEEDSILVCDFRGAIGERPSTDLQHLIWDERPVNLTETVRLLHAAADDDRISSVVVRLGAMTGFGWGTGAEIREGLAAIREARKPVEVHFEAGGDLSYYVASAATRIHLSPGGALFVDGIYGEVQFMKNLYGKVNISWEAVTAGEYKSYPETYISESMSAPFRKQIDRLLDDRFDSYLEAIAGGRGMSALSARNRIDEGPYLVPQDAIDAGLVDTLSFWSDFARSSGINEEGETPHLSIEEYRDGGGDPGRDASHEVGIVYVVGDIMPGGSRDGFGQTVAGSETLVEEIDRAAEDDDIEAIILRVSSPGGSVTASDAIWKALERAKEQKPVIASMGDVAASGGYWISAGADAIVCDPTTVTGSIGVFALRPSWDRLLDRVGIGVEEFTRGENAAMFQSAKPWTESHRALVEKGIVHSYDQFLERVSVGREMDVAEVKKIAGGRVWMGASAKRIGLVDELGGIMRAIEIAKEHAGIDADEMVALRYFPEEKSLWEQIRDGEFSIRSLGEVVRGALRGEIDRAVERGVRGAVDHALRPYGLGGASVENFGGGGGDRFVAPGAMNGTGNAPGAMLARLPWRLSE